MTAIDISNLDFKEIKRSFTEYLKSQDRFKDYNFEGSTLSVLLDILSYNTHYQAFYANMVANEAFIDSAVTRNSIVSIAKQLNYTPKSYTSSTAIVDLELLNPSQSEITRVVNGNYLIPKDTKFIVKNSFGTTFSFVSIESATIKNENGRYFARNLVLKEGVNRTITFIKNTYDTTQKFILPETNVDLSSIRVIVTESIDNVLGEENSWKKVDDFTQLSSDSYAFFVQETENLRYEIYFGDGIAGRELQNGNAIVVTYRITNGPEANFIGITEVDTKPSFSCLDIPNLRTLLVRDSSGKKVFTFGGALPETEYSIKFYAPRFYQAQDRAVTAEDYRVLLYNQYLDTVDSVFVWGGEDNSPPVYGKVFISIKPKSNLQLSTTEKLSISRNILKSKNIVSIIPEIVDPEYIYIEPNITIEYYPEKTKLTQRTLELLYKTNTISFSKKNLENFDKGFKYSSLIDFVLTYGKEISSVNCDIKIQKRLSPNIGRPTNYNLKFMNEIYHPIDGYVPVLSSTPFNYQDLSSTETVKPIVECYLDDDGFGNIRLYKIVNNEKVILKSDIGKINYQEGSIDLYNFNVQSIDNGNTFIKISVKPKLNDINSPRNTILLFDTDLLQIITQPKEIKTNATPFPYTVNR